MEQRLVVSGRELVKIAKITSVIGIKGGVKLTPLFFKPEELIELIKESESNVYMYSQSVFPKSIVFDELIGRKNTVVVSISGIDTFKKAKEVVGMFIVLDSGLYQSYLASTDNPLRYLNYRVMDLKMGELGTVSNIQRGGQLLLEIESDDDKEKKLVPFVKELIEEIDDINRLIKTRLPDGIFG